MKLFTRYSLVNLAANIAIFVVASIAFYFSIRYVLVHQIDEDLQIEQDEIAAFVKEHNRLPESFSVSDQIITFAPAQVPVHRHIATVKPAQIGAAGVSGNYRSLVFGISTQGQNFQVTVSKSLEGTDNLLQSILLVSISTILLILLVSALLNRYLLKTLWQPFYAALQAVKNVRVSRDQPLALPMTKIDEFTFLNNTLESITKESRLEYLSLKTFTENAAHEIQTPIAIIRSKLDLLIQDEHLTQKQSATLQGAYNAVEKLSRLNGSLLLLAKIENNQFEEREDILMKEKLEEKLQDFQELWQVKSISVAVSLHPVCVRMNRVLADILLNNLLSNATNHNEPGGHISIELNGEQLTVRNSGLRSALQADKLFQRFYKSSTGSASNGLGLSIVKQIADVSSMKLCYRFLDHEHCFTVFWPQDEKV
ncbi:sensor histidine kinase [Flavisolibacter nicotianae]|uniref:sensor histidine kinase n=1 Tax=Flavisolibacter nicotianae TaxID=2364882 RepID=UPI000EB0ABE1|nr:HAMP domain-containing sensor histidine kinase [Flavisolibacter nicotianae]